jgi:hypothetical protein
MGMRGKLGAKRRSEAKRGRRFILAPGDAAVPLDPGRSTLCRVNNEAGDFVGYAFEGLGEQIIVLPDEGIMIHNGVTIETDPALLAKFLQISQSIESGMPPKERLDIYDAMIKIVSTHH